MLIVVHFIVALSELLRAKVRAGCMKFEVQHCIYFFLMRVARGVSGQGMEVFKNWSGGGQMGAVRGLDPGRWEGAAADRN